VLPVLTIAARFRPQVVIAGLILTVITILAATFGADPAQSAREPLPVITTLALLVSVVAIGFARRTGRDMPRDANPIRFSVVARHYRVRKNR